ncbi:MAG: COQ9 family protein [Boseongicola sp.]|nr:MAG: COQ9 family protein [Boseongicola sp.]
MPDTNPNIRQELLTAILPHVAFDGWSELAFVAAADDIGIDIEQARATCPRGAIDLAIDFHRAGDQAMVTAFKSTDLSDMRYRDKVATALKLRVEGMTDREVIRRVSALFALPHNTADGAKLIWETADHIWTALGDTSTDANWYSKRATLSGVWAATVLFWLGDDSENAADTMAFIDRRIDNVMQIEKTKAQLREHPLTKPLMALQASILSGVKAPNPQSMKDTPGHWDQSPGNQ